MTPRKAGRAGRQLTGSIEPTVPGVLAALERRARPENVAGMARYGIVAAKVFGVSVAELRRMARQLGRNHALAFDLWATGWYEARMLASFIADAEAMTTAEMDRWAQDFDNWAITDTVCFSLFDRSPHAWSRVDKWSRAQGEFVRRAGFALLASLALHDRKSEDADYRRRLRLIEEFAGDERNFVKKGVSWALHAVGSRSLGLHSDALELATRLAASADGTKRWVGRDALRKLTSAPTLKRVSQRSAEKQ